MLQLVNVGHKSLADYGTIATRGLMDEIRRLAEPLQGKRVVHVSATAFGGGVAEINYTLIPLMQDAGLETEWRIIRGADEFFNVTKTIHNALQGNPQGLTAEQQEIFRRYNAENAHEFADEYDFVIAHDDPEGWEFYNQTVGYAAGDPDIFILSNLNNVGSVEVNAFQVASAVLMQKSIREGFGLTVTEALWKARPIVAGRAGGIVDQIQDGTTGWLVESALECAAACEEILRDP